MQFQSWFDLLTPASRSCFIKFDTISSYCQIITLQSRGEVLRTTYCQGFLVKGGQEGGNWENDCVRLIQHGSFEDKEYLYGDISRDWLTQPSLQPSSCSLQPFYLWQIDSPSSLSQEAHFCTYFEPCLKIYFSDKFLALKL